MECMLIGHYAVALAAKRLAPRVSLGTLLIAATLPDLLWPPLALLGLQHVTLLPSGAAAGVWDLASATLTHSLTATVAWAVALGIAYYGVRRRGVAAWLLMALVLSHWLLDALVVPQGLPLDGASSPLLGLGAWLAMPVAFALELVLFVVGAAYYLRITTARDDAGVYGTWAFLLFLLLVWTLAWFGPPPPNEVILDLTAAGQWLFVASGFWIDRHRQMATTAPAEVA